MANSGNKTTIIIVSSVILLGLTAYFVVRASKTMKDTKTKKNMLDELKKKQKDLPQNIVDNTQDTQPTPDNTTPPKTTTPTLNVPIMFGNSGDNVKKLQQLILQYDKTLLPKFKDDGKFGTETSMALNKIIGKGFIQNQQDVTKLVDEVRKRLASKVVTNMSLAPLGITLYK